MGQGNTPLLRSVGIARRTGAQHLYFKLESCNPSGSYKDRFVAAEIKYLMSRGLSACLATSSGNTGSALAAACARYGLRCLIVVNQDAPAGKLRQIRAHGATVVGVPGFVSSTEITRLVFDRLEDFANSNNTPLIVSAYRYSPLGMAGVESISSELAAELPNLTDVFVPVGGGGLYSAIVRGFQNFASRPHVHAVQPQGCPTLLNAVCNGTNCIEPVVSETRISGLSVPFDIDASLALSLLRAHGGNAVGVSDEEIFDAQRMLFREEGIYAEPAGASALAGYLRAVRERFVDSASTVVCLVTGHGFKDPVSARHIAQENQMETVSAENLLLRLPRILQQSEIHPN